MLVCLSSYSWLSGLLEVVDRREKQVVEEHLDEHFEIQATGIVLSTTSHLYFILCKNIEVVGFDMFLRN